MLPSIAMRYNVIEWIPDDKKHRNVAISVVFDIVVYAANRRIGSIQSPHCRIACVIAIPARRAGEGGRVKTLCQEARCPDGARSL